MKRQSFVDIGHAPRALLDARARRAATARTETVPTATSDTAEPADDMAVDLDVVMTRGGEPAAADLTMF